MPSFGAFELVVVLAIVILIFGVGRIGKIAGEMGKGIREFRKGLSGEEKNPPDEPKSDPKQE